MNILIKKKEKNTYEIKILHYIDIYNPSKLKKAVTNIIKRIKRKNKLKSLIMLDIYPSKYETIIILKDYNQLINLINITEVKISIHTDTIFLYEIDYHNIQKNKYLYSLYYYHNKYYLKIKKISPNEYLKLSEYTNLLYQDTDKILDNAIKIKL